MIKAKRLSVSSSMKRIFKEKSGNKRVSSSLTKFEFTKSLVLEHYGISSIETDVAAMVLNLTDMKNRFFEEIACKNTKNALEVAFISNQIIEIQEKLEHFLTWILSSHQTNIQKQGEMAKSMVILEDASVEEKNEKVNEIKKYLNKIKIVVRNWDQQKDSSYLIMQEIQIERHQKMALKWQTMSRQTKKDKLALLKQTKDQILNHS